LAATQERTAARRGKKEKKKKGEVSGQGVCGFRRTRKKKKKKGGHRLLPFPGDSQKKKKKKKEGTITFPQRKEKFFARPWDRGESPTAPGGKKKKKKRVFGCLVRKLKGKVLDARLPSLATKGGGGTMTYKKGVAGERKRTSTAMG